MAWCIPKFTTRQIVHTQQCLNTLCCHVGLYSIGPPATTRSGRAVSPASQKPSECPPQPQPPPSCPEATVILAFVMFITLLFSWHHWLSLNNRDICPLLAFQLMLERFCQILLTRGISVSVTPLVRKLSTCAKSSTVQHFHYYSCYKFC